VRQTDYSEIYRDGFLINTFLETKILTGSYSRGLATQQSQRHQRFPSFHDIDEVASSLLASQSAVFLFYDYKKKFLIILTLILQTGAFSYF